MEMYFNNLINTYDVLKYITNNINTRLNVNVIFVIRNNILCKFCIRMNVLKQLCYF